MVSQSARQSNEHTDTHLPIPSHSTSINIIGEPRARARSPKITVRYGVDLWTHTTPDQLTSEFLHARLNPTALSIQFGGQPEAKKCSALCLCSTLHRVVLDFLVISQVVPHPFRTEKKAVRLQPP